MNREDVTIWCRLTLETGSQCFCVSGCLRVCVFVCVCVCVCVAVLQCVVAEGMQKEDDVCETNMLLQKPEVSLWPIFSPTAQMRDREARTLILSRCFSPYLKL